LARYIGIFNRQTQAYITAALKDLNISFSEYILLTNLYEKEGLNQEELSSMLVIDKALTARSLKLLEQKGYVIRKVVQEDKRYKKIFLTEKAKGQKEYFYSLLQRWEDFTTEGMESEMKDYAFNGFRAMAEKSANANISELINLKGDKNNAVESNI